MLFFFAEGGASVFWGAAVCIAFFAGLYALYLKTPPEGVSLGGVLCLLLFEFYNLNILPIYVFVSCTDVCKLKICQILA